VENNFGFSPPVMAAVAGTRFSADKVSVGTMKNQNAAICLGYGVPLSARLAAIPWIRILVDIALVAAILTVASNFLTVR
jgi:hypothetical protein